MPRLYEDISEVLAVEKMFAAAKARPPEPIGFSGQTYLDEPVEAEYLTELQGEAGLEIYDKMRRSDGAVNASLFALKLPLKMAEWRVEPASERRADQKAAEFIEESIFNNSKSWMDTLEEILTCLDFGFSIFEPVYERTGGGITLAKMGFRPQRTITKWITDSGGSLIEIEQTATVGGMSKKINIPVEQALIFTIKKEGNNWEGISLLRTAYKDWSHKCRKENLSAISADRFAFGIPVITLPEGARKEDEEKAKNIGKKYRANSGAYIICPPGGKVEILKVADTRADLLPDINYHNGQIAKNVLTNFLELGMAGTGTYALAKELKEFFLMSLGAVAKNIENILNSYLVPRLMEWNFGEGMENPRIAADKISSINLKDWSEAIGNLAAKGLIQVDDDMEEFVRGVAQLPAFDRKAREEERAAKEEQARILQEALSARTQAGQPADQPEDQEQEEESAKQQAAAGHRCNHRHGTEGNEEDPREFNPRRELLEHEKNVDWKLIASTTGEGQIGAGKIVLLIQATMIKKLTDAAALMTPAYLEKIKLDDPTNEGRLRKKAYDIFDFGKEQVKREAEKMKKAAIKTAASDKTPAELIALMDDWVILTIAKIRNRLKTSTAETLASAAWKSAKNELKRQLLGDNLGSLSDLVISQEGKGLINAAFTLGRDFEIQHLSDIGKIGKTVIGSSMLDGDVCEPCRENIDGKEFEIGSPEYERNMPPYFDCLGGRRCRCTYLLGEW